MNQSRLDQWLLSGLIVIAVALQLPLWAWLVEDAAISFAYARSLAEGLGAVAAPGGERVEGYSNPAWVAILSAVIGAGGDPFGAVRWLGLGLGVLAVPITCAWGRWTAPRPAGLVAAGLVALSAQHAIWSQSGLENPLYSALLAWGGFRLVVGRDREWVAPLVFLALALTRPEGIATALVAAGIAVTGASSPQGARLRLARWVQLLGVPLVGYHALRFVYFAQWWPATYHAKIGDEGFAPLAWRGRGWRQLREVTAALWLAPWLVLIPFGTGGLDGPRGRGAAAIASILVLAMLPVLPDPVRAGLLCLAFTAVPTLAIGVPERRGALVATALLWCGLLFCLRSGGDWMKGYRFVSLLVVPGAVSIAAGLVMWIRRIPPIPVGWRRAGVLVAIASVAIPQIHQLWIVAEAPTTTPHDVRRRVDHYTHLAMRLGLDRPRVVDHDMGGLLWWGSGLIIRDSKGLVDLPFALHGSDRAFVAEELFEVDRLGDASFDFAHAHASTARALKPSEAFRRDYVEIAGGYPLGALEPHGGQVVRRDLFLGPIPAHPPLEIDFGRGIRIVGVRVQSPEVAPGSGVLVEMDLVSRHDVRVLAVLSRGAEVVASYELAPGYDWVPPRQWRGEAFTGRFPLRIPEDTPLGTYDLGFVIVGSWGIVPARTAVGAVIPDPPVYARGEARLPERVVVVDRARMGAEARADLEDVAAMAESGRCDAAEASWGRALAHRIRSREWRAGHRPAVASQIAACWAKASRRAKRGDELLHRIDELRRGRQWDPRSEAVLTEAWPLAAVAWERGLAARLADDPDAAFRWFTAAVHANPSHAWARRWAEQARTQRD